MMYLVYLGNLLFAFDTSEAAVSFLENAKLFYFDGDFSSFILTILTRQEFNELENKILEKKEKLETLKKKGMIK